MFQPLEEMSLKQVRAAGPYAVAVLPMGSTELAETPVDKNFPYLPACDTVYP